MENIFQYKGGGLPGMAKIFHYEPKNDGQSAEKIDGQSAAENDGQSERNLQYRPFSIDCFNVTLPDYGEGGIIKRCDPAVETFQHRLLQGHTAGLRRGRDYQEVRPEAGRTS